MYNWRDKWSAVLSPKSMRTLTTPLALYCKSYLAAVIGPETAEEVIRYSFSFSAKMDEGEEETTELDDDLALFFYPVLGILRGLVREGFTEEEAEEIVAEMLEFAPEELKRRPGEPPEQP